MKQSSLWEKEAFRNTADVIIIGAGMVGLSAALFYKRCHADAKVVVLERGSIPEGASTRNAGFACVGSITEHVADMEKESRKNIKKRIRQRYRGLLLLRKTVGDEAIRYENCGGYELFTDSGTFTEAVQHIPEFNEWLREVTGAENVYKTRQLNGYDVIYNRLEGALHPGKMMRELIDQVQAAGVDICWNTTVKQVKHFGLVVLTNGHTVEGDEVLVATNGLTKSLLPEISVEPARGVIMVSKPWPDIPWKGIFHYDRGYVYFRNIGDRLLLGGGRNVAVDEEHKDQFGINTTIKNYLIDFASQTLNIPAGLFFEQEWSGIMGFTPTKTPVVKRVGDHCVAAAGLSGMGIAIGMNIAQKASELISSE